MRFQLCMALVVVAVLGMIFPAAVAAVTSARDPATLLTQAAELESSEPEQALVLAQQARALEKDERGQLAADAGIARLQRILTDYPKAIEVSEQGLARATALNDRGLMAKFRYVLARTQWNLGNYPAAMEQYLVALRLAEEVGDEALAFDAHSGVSTMFGDFKQPDQAQFHLEQARRIAEKLGDQVRLGDLHKIVGNSAFSRGDLQTARAEHAESLRIHTAAGSERGVGDALQNLGYTNEHLGDLLLAQSQTEESIKIYRRLGLRRQLINAMRQLGRILVKQGHADDGVRELEKTLALALELKGRSQIAYSYRELAKAYEAQGNLAEAYKAQQKLLTANEAVFSERSNQQLAILNGRYINERRQLEIDLLRRDQALKSAELARTRAERYWLLASVALMAIALTAVISRQRLKLLTEKRIVAETRAAKDAAEKADALKTRLLGIASHDLKNPLSAMMGGLMALRDTHANDGTFIDELIGEGERMAELISDLLDQAALESGQLKLMLSEMEVMPLVQKIVTAQQTRARAKGIELTFNQEILPGEGMVSGDADRLRQVFTNLIDNALKFTPHYGRVTVTLRQVAGTVRVLITDTGPGLSAEDLPKLFVPFSRLSAQPTGGETSTGLGLSICHELVSLHGGQLLAQGEPGAGSTFTVVLPQSVATESGR